MRYSIMLQVVGIITLIFVGTAGLFAWLQNRESLTESQSNLLDDQYINSIKDVPDLKYETDL